MANEIYSYDRVGVVEDVSDVISNISPTETPFTSMVGMGPKMTQRTHEYLEDTLAAPADVARIEGHTFTNDTTTTPTVRTIRIQTYSKTLEISEIAERTKLYGRASELAYQVAKKGKEAKIDVEHTMVGLDQAAVVGDTTSTAARMASASQLIVSGQKSLNSGTPRALTETLLLTAMQTAYNGGVDFDRIMVKPADAVKFGDFAAASGRNRDFGDSKKIVNVVDVYVSPYGEVKVVLNRRMKSSNALMFTPSMWERRALRNWGRVALAKTADTERHAIVADFTLKHKNWAGSHLIGDLS